MRSRYCVNSATGYEECALEGPDVETRLCQLQVRISAAFKASRAATGAEV